MECLAFAYLLNSYQHDKEFNPIDKKSLLYLTCRLYHISSQKFVYNLYIRIKCTQSVFVDVICSNSSTQPSLHSNKIYFRKRCNEISLRRECNKIFFLMRCNDVPDKMQQDLVMDKMKQSLVPDEMQQNLVLDKMKQKPVPKRCNKTLDPFFWLQSQVEVSHLPMLCKFIHSKL